MTSPIGSRAVLADAGPLFATTDDRDQYHLRAADEFDQILAERRPIVVPYPTLWECYNVVLRHHSIASSHAWLAEIGESVNLVVPTFDHYAAAMARIARYRDQPISLFDALLATLSDDLGLPVWTYDHHFDVMGVAVWR